MSYPRCRRRDGSAALHFEVREGFDSDIPDIDQVERADGVADAVVVEGRKRL